MNVRENSASLAGNVSLGGKLSVHRLGFGTMRLTGEGIWGPPKDRKGALTVLRRAVELGVNFIDTADSYGPYISEELIAEALFPYPKDVVIATKGGWNRPGPNQWTHDASPAHLRQAVEGSLKRLRLGRIDVYQLHIPDPIVPFEASVETLAELQREGKIRLVALSNVTQEHIERARKIVQNHGGHNRRNQRVAPVVDGLDFIFQKPRQIQDQRGLSQFRGLQRNRPHVKPAMRPVRAIQKKDRDQQQRSQSKKRENHRRMLQPFVVHLHGHDHDHESRNRPYQLLHQKFVSRSKPLLGHHGRGAENHDQPNEYQDRGHGEHPAIDADPLSHENSFHHGAAQTCRSLSAEFWTGDN